MDNCYSTSYFFILQSFIDLLLYLYHIFYVRFYRFL
nr:MAG TPA: hypothetical protein [Caudoviricetes sp.]